MDNDKKLVTCSQDDDMVLSVTQRRISAMLPSLLVLDAANMWPHSHQSGRPYL